jgi:hypothetical protein
MALNEGKHTGEFLLSEANGTRSREQVVISSTAAAMVAGTLVGRITATGEYAAYNDAASDGTEVARGILYTNVADSTADQKAVIIARDAEVIGSELTGSNANGVADLLAIGIIVR